MPAEIEFVFWKRGPGLTVLVFFTPYFMTKIFTVMVIAMCWTATGARMPIRAGIDSAPVFPAVSEKMELGACPYAKEVSFKDISQIKLREMLKEITGIY